MREAALSDERERIDEAPPVHIERTPTHVKPSERKQKEKQVPLFAEMADARLPPLDLLDESPPNLEAISTETLEFTSRLIEKKLRDFNVEAVVVAAYPGPVITRYEIEPAVGVKGSQIVNLAKDLARALSLVSIRVVETIPGKNLMGLELPNPRRQVVKLSEILGSVIYNESHSLLTLGLGKDISGKPVVVDLARMPHLLVAGTTGSGKSVGINAMILSILYKADPSQVRMILIDPKMLELSVYEGIPHLLAPVVTDMREAGNALQWCVGEMDKRYRLLSKLGVRSLTSYNQKIADARAKGEFIANPFSLTPAEPEPLETLPMIVVVIDELADLMMVSSKKVEELIARIAQKARASGMHLILATQRPSVDVITGLIKANIPARISYQVSSRVDSRTISGPDGFGIAARAGRHALPSAGNRPADPRARRVRRRRRGAPRGRRPEVAWRAAIHRGFARSTRSERGKRRRECEWRLRKRGRSVIRPGGGDRAEESSCVDLAGAAAFAHRIQPGRAPVGRHGARWHGVCDAEQRQSRDFGAGARRLRTSMLNALRAVLILAAALANDAQAAALDQLRSFLTQTNSARGDFVQRVIPRSGVSKQPVASGHFVFQRPGKFRWIYEKPYEQLIVADGQRLVLFDKDLNQVTIKKLQASLPSSPASILFGSNEFEKEFEVSDAGARDGLEWIVAKPRAKDTTFERIEIGFRDGLPQAMLLADGFGQQTQLTFTKVDRNPKLDADAFRFTVPKGADVLEDR